MKKLSGVLVVLGALLFLFIAIPAGFAAEHQTSVDKGRALFNDPKLGTNGKTCNDCHKNGAGLEKAADRKDLEAMINGCIAVNLKGSPLKPASPEMRSLMLYIRGVGSARKPAPKKTSVGC